jgi:hypothetical protein
MDGIEKFLQLHRQRLLAYLDGVAPESPEEPGPKEFVEQVLEDWSRLSAGKKLGVPRPRERTFWFALYQLEELVEYPVRGDLDSYEGILMQNLAQVRELLRVWKELPDGFHATRPGEDLGAP